jgi:hypothetical protein
LLAYVTILSPNRNRFIQPLVRANAFPIAVAVDISG